MLALVGIPLGPVVEEKRQVRRIRAHHPAGICLLRGFADRSFSGAARHACRPGSAHGWLISCFLRSASFAVPRLRSAPLNWLRSGRRGSGTQSGSLSTVRAPPRERLRTRLHPAPRVQRQLSHSARRLYLARLLRLSGDDPLHLPRAGDRLHACSSCWETFFATRSRPLPWSRISAQRHALSALQRRPLVMLLAVLVTFGADAALQRNHRDQGDRNQHLPHRHAGDRRRRGAGRRIVLRRPVLSAPHQQAPGSAAQPDQRASLRKPICAPIANGFSVRTTTSTTTSSSIPIATSSAISPSFSSIPPASPSRAASTPTAPTGPTI